MKERTFWKVTAAGLVVLVTVGVLTSGRTATQLPAELLSFALGSLVSIGAGYTVVSKHSSPVTLSAKDRASLRKQQYVVGLALSGTLALLFLLPSVRDVPFAWFLVPPMLVTPYLMIREFVVRARRPK